MTGIDFLHTDLDAEIAQQPPPFRRWLLRLQLEVAGLRLKLLESVRLRAGLGFGGRCNLEVLAGVFLLLAFDVAPNGIRVDRAHARSEIPARPRVLTPVTPPQLGKSA
jgi:hypothetical protein